METENSTPFKAKLEDKNTIVTVSARSVACKDEKTGETYFEIATKEICLLKMASPHTVLLNWRKAESVHTTYAEISARHARNIHDCIRDAVSR